MRCVIKPSKMFDQNLKRKKYLFAKVAKAAYQSFSTGLPVSCDLEDSFQILLVEKKLIAEFLCEICCPMKLEFQFEESVQSDGHSKKC